MFDLADYRRGAGELTAPSRHLMAVTAIESSGETTDGLVPFWTQVTKYDSSSRRAPARMPWSSGQ